MKFFRRFVVFLTVFATIFLFSAVLVGAVVEDSTPESLLGEWTPRYDTTSFLGADSDVSLRGDFYGFAFDGCNELIFSCTKIGGRSFVDSLTATDNAGNSVVVFSRSSGWNTSALLTDILEVVDFDISDKIAVALFRDMFVFSASFSGSTYVLAYNSSEFSPDYHWKYVGEIEDLYVFSLSSKDNIVGSPGLIWSTENGYSAGSTIKISYPSDGKISWYFASGDFDSLSPAFSISSMQFFLIPSFKITAHGFDGTSFTYGTSGYENFRVVTSGSEINAVAQSYPYIWSGDSPTSFYIVYDLNLSSIYNFYSPAEISYLECSVEWTAYSCFLATEEHYDYFFSNWGSSFSVPDGVPPELTGSLLDWLGDSNYDPDVLLDVLTGADMLNAYILALFSGFYTVSVVPLLLSLSCCCSLLGWLLRRV